MQTSDLLRGISFPERKGINDIYGGDCCIRMTLNNTHIYVHTFLDKGFMPLQKYGN